MYILRLTGRPSNYSRRASFAKRRWETDVQLVKSISTETDVPVKQILLLRHSTDSLKVLKKYGATIEEYTAVQPVGSKYDFYRDPNNQSRIVVVIVDDEIYGAFKVRGIKKTGNSYDLASNQYILFDKHRGKPPRQCHFFDLKVIPISTAGQKITGWEGRSRIPVQRYGDKFFLEVSIVGQQKLFTATSLSVEFTNQVNEARKLSQRRRLAGC